MQNQPDQTRFEQNLAAFRPRKLRDISFVTPANDSFQKRNRLELSPALRYGTVALTSFLLGLATMYFVLPSNEEAKPRSKGPSTLQPFMPMLDEQAIATLRRPADLLHIRPRPTKVASPHPDDALPDWEERQRVQFQALQRTLLLQQGIDQPTRRSQP